MTADAKPSPLFSIVLHEPEIPNNTGNIGRTCIATGCDLHLVHPLGFSTDERACRRAGLDYWPRLRPTEHADWPSYLTAAGHTPQHPRLWLFSTAGDTPLWNADFRKGDHLVFGKETAGLPDELLTAWPGRTVAMPMQRGERSLNVATAVCAVVYEGLRQLRERGELTLDRELRFDA